MLWSWLGTTNSQRVGGADDLAAGLDDLLPLPDHAHDGSGAHVVDKVAEEGLAGQIGVVLLGVRLLDRHHLHGAEVESLLLEAGDDLTDEAALDAVGLDHDVSLLHLSVCEVCETCDVSGWCVNGISPPKGAKEQRNKTVSER